MTDEAAVVAAAAKIESEVGPVDVLVNNAAIIRRTPLLEMPLEEWERVIRTDLKALSSSRKPSRPK